MIGTYRAPGFSSGRILLPNRSVDLTKWAVIACDQFTSQRDYWDAAERIVGDSPSALRLTLPEIDLSCAEERTGKIRAAMEQYLEEGVLSPCVEDGFVLTDRVTTQGHRLGLIGMIDLEEYSFSENTESLVRPTERTIPERVPPRARIRAGARLELPHVMMLLDDPDQSVIEPLTKRNLRGLYDFDLMLGGGRIAGYAVEGDAAEEVASALRRLWENCGGLLYAVGDGNHSLAAAKACWDDLRKSLAPEDRKNHPARYAMVELVNIHCPALVFEPIHRLVKGADFDQTVTAFEKWLNDRGIPFAAGGDVRFVSGDREKGFRLPGLPVRELQEFLTAFAGDRSGVELDYIHGEEDLRNLAKEEGTGALLRVMDKSELFRFVREQGVLPRKAFSMGEARDKRYYLEAREIGFPGAQ